MDLAARIFDLVASAPLTRFLACCSLRMIKGRPYSSTKANKNGGTTPVSIKAPAYVASVNIGTKILPYTIDMMEVSAVKDYADIDQ